MVIVVSSLPLTVTATVSGASFTAAIAISTVAGDEGVPLLSVTVKLNDKLPLKLLAGVKTKPDACAGVKFIAVVTAVTPSAKYNTPCAAVGKLTN